MPKLNNEKLDFKKRVFTLKLRKEFKCVCKNNEIHTKEI